MSHTGGKEGTYPGTRASAAMLSDDDTNWGTKSLVILDMPFTAVADTLLLPWDVFRKDNSVRSRLTETGRLFHPRNKAPVRGKHDRISRRRVAMIGRQKRHLSGLCVAAGDPVFKNTSQHVPGKGAS
ncbi:hypothetical protein L1887_45225 [Cichorium endivia]|nr:hypothetical protein L1887_45225 [Cichorium endivia]